MREIYGNALTPAAAASIANHMRYSARCDPLLTLHHLQANLEAALPKLVPVPVPVGSRPSKGGSHPPKTRATGPGKASPKPKGGGHDKGYGYGGKTLGGKQMSMCRALGKAAP